VREGEREQGGRRITEEKKKKKNKKNMENFQKIKYNL
jgi:hypothetical protein